MRIERIKNRKRLVIVAETDEESKVLDEFFGSKVGEEGQIARVIGELKLSDDLLFHYLALQKLEEM